MAIADTLAPLRFGRFLLEPSRRLLSVDGETVTLSSRAFDLLLMLIENRDRIVSKDEIITHVWRGMAVEDNNLAVQMSALRRALGERAGDPQFVMTVPGQGYRFVAALAESLASPAVSADRPAPEADLPPPAQTIAVVAAPAAVPAARNWRVRALWPAAVSAALVLSVLFWVSWPAPRAPIVPHLSIVVLPFRNLTGDAQQDYLADAISDDLTTDLSHIPGSIVIARTSSDVYKNRAVDAGEIGRALHVRYLLEGSIRNEGPTYHVNAQLIDALDGSHLWANRFDMVRDNLGRVQSRIVAQIASALKFTLVEVAVAQSEKDRPRNPDALDLFFQARSVLKRDNTLEGATRAAALLEKAVAAHPDFPDALATLGIALLRKIQDFDDPGEQTDFIAAKTAISKAMTLAPQNALAITANGMLASLRGDCVGAAISLHRALDLNPDLMLARNLLAQCARQLGHMEEMIADTEDIFIRDPAGPSFAARQQMVGMGYLMLGKPQEAIGWLEKSGAGQAVEEHPAPLTWKEWRQLYLIAATQEAGRPAQAAELYRNYAAHWPNRSVWQMSSYDSHALSMLPGYAAYRAALVAAGMPASSREDFDAHVTPSDKPVVGSDVDPTPMTVPGAVTVTTPKVQALIDSGRRPFILDYGLGAAVIPGAIWVWAGGLGVDQDELVEASGLSDVITANRPIVIMSDGPFGWQGYNAALHFIAKTASGNVLWYRGGEEAWVKGGNHFEDKRSP